jgi:uncharacterized membrane protein
LYFYGYLLDLFLFAWKIAFCALQHSSAVFHFFTGARAMSVGTLNSRIHMDAHAPIRAMIIKRARENVRLSHQRMRERIRRSRA